MPGLDKGVEEESVGGKSIEGDLPPLRGSEKRPMVKENFGVSTQHFWSTFVPLFLRGKKSCLHGTVW